MVIPGIEATN